MIHVYFLPVETINGTEQVSGIEYIHDALLDATQDPLVFRLIMDFTAEELLILADVALSFRDATPEEIQIYLDQVIISEPDPDIIIANEILSNSPFSIPQSEMWELMHIFARLLHIHA